MKPTAAASTPVGSKRLQGAFHATALFVLITVSLYWGHAVFVPLALSALFAFILSSPAEWVERKGLGRTPSVLLVTIAAFGLLGAVGTVATFQLRGLVADLPRYEKNIDLKMQPVYALLHRLKALESNLEDVAPPATAQADPADQPTSVVVKPPGAGALSWLPTLARPLVEILVNGVLVVVLTVFMLMQRETFRDRLIRLAGRSRLTSTTRALGDAADRVGKFLLLQLATNACLGAVIAVGLYLLRVPYAPLWGMLVTVLRFVPYIGYWVAALAATAMSAAVAPGWTQPLLVLGLFGVLDLLLTNVIEPLVFSHGTGVSPVALLVSAVFWATLWGPVGLLLSTPLTVCLAVLGKHVPALGFLAVLLGDAPALDPAARYYNRLLARDYDDATILLEEYAAGHPPEAVYDEIVLPALAQTKTDRDQEDVTAEEERAVYEATRGLLDGVAGRAVAAADPPSGRAKPVPVIGCPVWGEADTLALQMLGDSLRAAGGELVVTTPDLAADAVGQAAAGGRPVVVCLATLSPGGLAQAGTVLARVRRAYPKVKILVGRWGQTGDTKKTDEFLRKFGVDGIGWSLRETLSQLVPGAGGPPTPTTGTTAAVKDATTARA